MTIPREIELRKGSEKAKYYYWSEYETMIEAVYFAREIKKERKKEGINMKYFILKSQDSWFLPVPKYILYLNKKIRII